MTPDGLMQCTQLLLIIGQVDVVISRQHVRVKHAATSFASPMQGLGFGASAGSGAAASDGRGSWRPSMPPPAPQAFVRSSAGHSGEMSKVYTKEGMDRHMSGAVNYWEDDSGSDGPDW